MCFLQKLLLCSLVGFLSVLGTHGYTSCPDGWIPYGSSCYFFGFDQRLPFMSAQHLCIQYGANLVDVGGGREWNFLNGLLRHFAGSTWWIGLNDLEVEGKFEWIGLENPPTNNTFTDWAKGSPALANSTSDHDCVFLHPGDYTMTNVGCTSYFQPICKKSGSGEQPVFG
ncbi:FRAS1-related extracellular matrix protein 1 [Mactra antiquata]